MRVRRPWAAFLLLLLAGLLVFLLARDATDERAEQALSVEDPKADPQRQMLRASNAAAEPSRGPALETRRPPAWARSCGEHGPVTVKVLGPGGAALPGVAVGVLPSSLDRGRSGHAPRPSPTMVLVTDANGEAVFADLPYDGTVSVLPSRDDPNETDASVLWLLETAGVGRPYVPVRGERVVIRLAVGRWLTVRAVDAEGGRSVRDAQVAVKTPTPRMTPLGSARQFLLLTRGEETTTLRLAVKARRDWVAWETPCWNVRVSPYAKSLLAVYPLRPEVWVGVLVSEPDGALIASPVVHLMVAQRQLSSKAVTADAYGRLRVTGVPFLPGEHIQAWALRPQGEAVGRTHAVIGDSPDRDLHLAITVPPEDPTREAIGIGGGSGGAFRGRGGRRNLRASGRSHRPEGSVVVTVKRRHGTPAVGAHVRLRERRARTDARGRAHFREVWPGTYAVSVKQVGLLPIAGQVTVRGREQARVELREGQAGRLEVRVEDDTGRPLSFATLAVTTPSRQPWVDLDGDVQRLDPFTDHEGRRVLTGVEPGRVTIRATWGSRRGSIAVVVKAGETHPARIVLKRPSAP